MKNRFLLLGIVFLPLAALAHVNSPDIYYDGFAGPYHLLITVRPPAVIPGIAAVDIRCDCTDVEQIHILPLLMSGPAAKLAPSPDVVQPSGDPQSFTGRVWLMVRGSWKVQVDVDGKRGTGHLSVPVAAVPTSAKPLRWPMATLLGGFAILLVLGFLGIVGAASGEAQLEPARELTPAQRRRSLIAAGLATVLGITAVVLANSWWVAEADTYEKTLYKLPRVTTSLQDGNRLVLQLQNPNDSGVEDHPAQQLGRDSTRYRLDDLVPDHGHLVHLFLVSMPDMKSFWHLHPDQAGPARFGEILPIMPAGTYRIYMDIVHSTGISETEVGDIDLPAIAGASPRGDDAGVADLSAADRVAKLSERYRMVWEKNSAPLKSQQPNWFRFRIEDKDGKPAADLEPYMGMAGHAVFLSTDGNVFAHVHPAGSVSMAALDMAQQAAPGSGMNGENTMHHGIENAEVAFPYGFPQPGEYRIFVQVKVAGHVETASFSAHVEN